ncbi:hypothetical protein [Herbaspirillum sp. C7C8]|uniref:hypothetical protein n=1 Tax=Herbaspirillum sp. C7C8 TaxID=2736665 RepID=UPI001F51B6DF|nr:hypothetical protein [Herbaspirillum sp. C7C8]MCI1003275.1 hypothetical protein [Herbaspirillum sp. C7C8]
MELNFRKIKNRTLAIFMPIVLVGFFYSIVTGKNVGPTYKKLEIIRGEMKWIRQTPNGDVRIYANGEVSKSGVASSYLIIDPDLWHYPSKETFDERGWKPLSMGVYCKEGIQLKITPSSYMGKTALSIAMTYDDVTSDACHLLARN